MREQSDALTRPYVVVTPYIPAGSALIYLRIENTGRASASDLRLELDRDFYQWGTQKDERNLRCFTAFTKPIDQLPPGASLVFGLAQGFVLHGPRADESVTPTTFSVRVSYSYEDRKLSETVHIDLRPYAQSMAPPDPLIEKLDDVVKALKGSR